MQQLPLDDQLIAGQLGAVGVFHLPQAGGGFGVTQVVGAQPPGEGQAAALEREQILFGAEVFRAAQKLQIKDDVSYSMELPGACRSAWSVPGEKTKMSPVRVG